MSKWKKEQKQYTEKKINRILVFAWFTFAYEILKKLIYW